MLRDLTIEQYRAFNTFSVDGLARVNLLVGMNNSGKTSFLEAVYLLVNQGNPWSLIELLRERREFEAAPNQPATKMYDIAQLFHQRDPRPSAHPDQRREIRFGSLRDNELSLAMWLRPVTASFTQEVPLSRVPALLSGLENADMPFELGLLYRRQNPMHGDGLRIPVSRDLWLQPRFFPADGARKPYHFITTNHPDHARVGELWDTITLTPEEDRVIEALQILEPRVERISFTSQQRSTSGILLKLKGAQAPVPLGSMGEGMRRILVLAMSAVMSQAGVLLVDEIDTGLYYQTQTQMWRLLIETAQRLEVQVFATTHSWDCVLAFQEALALTGGDDAGRLLRLERHDDTLQAVAYSAEELDIATRQAIEVR